MDKRGEFSTVARIILLVVFAVLILFAVGRFVYFIYSQSAENACAQSIVKSGLDKVPNFQCKAERMTISKDNLESQAGGELDSEGLDDLVKRTIANEMYACWKMTGKGMVDPYKDSYEVRKSTSWVSGIFRRTDIFLICDIIEFSDIPDFKGLLFWMMLNKPQRGNEPYFDSFYGRKPTEEEILEFAKKEDSYKTERGYVVAWKHTAESSDSQDSIVFLPYEELIEPVTAAVKYMPIYATRYVPILMN